MEVNERIKLFMERKSLSSAEVSDKADIQTSTFSHFLNGRNKPSLDVITKIHQAYPELNLFWILYGTGEMFASVLEESTNGGGLFTPTDGNPTYLSSGMPGNTSMGIPNAPLQATLGVAGAVNTVVAQAQAIPEKPPRKITEIRVFFDDNTYETFRNP